MKISAYDLDLKSTRDYTASFSQKITREFSFADIMDGGKRAAGAVFENQTAISQGPMVSTRRVSGTWVEYVTYQGRDALSPTDDFRLELEKMRRIMEDVMARLEQVTSRGCRCRLSRIDHVYVRSIPQRLTAWEFSETRTASYQESEQTRVSAGGTVKTADNREIDFSLDMTMARSFVREEYFTRTETGYALVDPLIIHSGMAAPRLAGSRFAFDLDLDGETEDLPLPEPGTGFLSLDLNGDGKINDGKELFGPATGDGFGELAAHDLDQNDWIDENDPVFDQLTLWEQAESGGMVLTRIRDAGIGAIYLAGIASPFDLTSANNDLLARVSKTSIALTEAGEVLPVQEMDYTV